MVRSHTYRFALVLMAIWLLAVQSFSAAHATTHGDMPHEHEGVSCAVLVMADEDFALLPSVDVPSFVPVSPIATEFPAFTPLKYQASQTRAPPPRAPPYSH